MPRAPRYPYRRRRALRHRLRDLVDAATRSRAAVVVVIGLGLVRPRKVALAGAATLGGLAAGAAWLAGASWWVVVLVALAVEVGVAVAVLTVCWLLGTQLLEVHAALVGAASTTGPLDRATATPGNVPDLTGPTNVTVPEPPDGTVDVWD